MSMLNLAPIKARQAAAEKELIHICKDPAKNFVMRVPVKDYDSDRVLSASLDDIDALVKEVERLRELVDSAFSEGHACGRCAGFEKDAPTCSTAWQLSNARQRLEGGGE